MRNSYKAIAAATLGAIMLATVGCGSQPITPREEGTLGGCWLGAGTGAIIGRRRRPSRRGRGDRRRNRRFG